MTINSARMERLRRARSLNDVVAIGTEVGKDITRVRNISKVLGIESIAATIKFSHDKVAGTKPGKINVTKKQTAPSDMGAELSSFKSPPLNQVLQHSSVIHSLQENLQELEVAAAMVRTTFNRAKNQAPALKALDALVKEARTTLQNAYDSLGYIAKKHLPKEMALVGEEMRTWLIDNLDRRHYSNLSTSVYVTVGQDAATGKLPHQQFGTKAKKPTKTKLSVLPKPKKKETEVPTKEELKQDILFAFYINIEDLKDSSGAVLSNYYVILTGVISARSKKMRYFLTGLPEFQAPGVYAPGAEVATPGEAIQRLRMLLSTNDILSSLEKKPMPINTADAARKGFNRLPGVSSTYVADDSLWVVMKKTKDLDAAIEKVVGHVFPLLNKAVGNDRRTTRNPIKYKHIIRKGENIIQFFLTPNVKKSDSQPGITAEQLMDLKESLGIPAHVMEDIKKVLKRHI